MKKRTAKRKRKNPAWVEAQQGRPPKMEPLKPAESAVLDLVTDVLQATPGGRLQDMKRKLQEKGIEADPAIMRAVVKYLGALARLANE